MKKLSLKRLLAAGQKKPLLQKDEIERRIEKLQLEMLRVQQGLWHGKGRAILVLEGFDAAGKGGAIRTLTEKLDPRGFRVHPIGPPGAEEQAKHYLYRFWKKLPAPGEIAIFDRSWYGRLLVEKVENLAPKNRIRDAYGEINDFERALRSDGVVLLKFFLGISKKEQLERFEDRLNDPYKQWKISEADIRARAKWDKYVDAVDKIFARTQGWSLVPADYKHCARHQIMSETTAALKPWEKWIEKKANARERRAARRELEKLGK